MCVFTDKLDNTWLSVKVDQSLYSVHQSNFRLSDKLETRCQITSLAGQSY